MNTSLDNHMGYTCGIFICLLLFGLSASSGGHVDNAYLLEGCGSCHVGHGMTNEPMLAAHEEEFCYQCHGSDAKRSAMKSSGKLSPAAPLADLEREFAKPYRHPVVEGVGHSPTERLPKLGASSASHAECVDCHNPHQRTGQASGQVRDVAGYSLTGQYLDKSLHEYEICFKCHFDDNSLSEDRGNSFKDFSPINTSQHPVTEASAGRSISLNKSLGGSRVMKCTACHTNDDPNGPVGPHGSNYRYLLSGNYETDKYADESPFAYQFCYSCHDRSSILSDASFAGHREHILGNPTRGIRGTSCYTCHASHSSRSNLHLIEFNRDAVGREKRTGQMYYRSTGDGSGECSLLCHGHSHVQVKYSR